MEDKLNIAVIFGGCSPEYSVSLESAYAVISHMDSRRYTPVLVGITPDGEWFHYTGDIRKIAEDTWHSPQDCTPAVVSPSRNAHELLVMGRGVQRIHLDAAFPILHGRNGEDGTVQGLFELAGIPLVGCGVLASALCMDKDRAHRMVRAAGVAAPDSLVLERGADMEDAVARAEGLGYPLFVKPVKAGSSYGITKVTERGQLSAAFQLAFAYDDEIILELSLIHILLRRAGIEVKLVGIGGMEITGSHGITVRADLTDEELDFSDLEMMVLPGGLPGATNLEESRTVQSFLTFCQENDRWIAAICAAPYILGRRGPVSYTHLDVYKRQEYTYLTIT